MKVEIKKKEDFKTTLWTGGKTTELFIFPQNAEYQKRNFDLRISTATIDVDFSEFTSLPGIQRKLMILKGEIKIIHENHYEKVLQKFDQDSFQGDWKTVSYGKAVDFNVMSKSAIQTQLSDYEMKNGDSYLRRIDSKFSFYILYLLKGKVEFIIDLNTYVLNEGEMLILNELDNNIQIKISSLSDVEIVETTVGVEK